jgi:hypothetical protein
MATSMVTLTTLSAITMTVNRFGANPIRVSASVRRPAGSTRRALPVASVVALRFSDRTRKPASIPIDSRTVTSTVPESGRCASSGAMASRSSATTTEKLREARNIGDSRGRRWRKQLASLSDV